MLCSVWHCILLIYARFLVLQLRLCGKTSGGAGLTPKTKDAGSKRHQRIFNFYGTFTGYQQQHVRASQKEGGHQAASSIIS
jgi:hypothetical protein